MFVCLHWLLPAYEYTVPGLRSGVQLGADFDPCEVNWGSFQKRNHKSESHFPVWIQNVIVTRWNTVRKKCRFSSETMYLSPPWPEGVRPYPQKCWCLHRAHTKKTNMISSIRRSNIQRSTQNNLQQHLMHIQCIYISIVYTPTAAHLWTLLIFIKMGISNTSETGEKHLEKCRFVGHFWFPLDSVTILKCALSLLLVMKSKIRIKNSDEDLEQGQILNYKG